MKMFEFVITGGPCAGKTTCLTVVEKYLSSKGYTVVVVPETATEVILSGISPTNIPADTFQEIILKRSLNKEETTRLAMNAMGKDCVIIYDRGVLDGKAYVTNDKFKQLLQDNNLNEIELRDQYNAVFHLVTAADGAEEFYTLANNTARSETIEQAREIDVKTKNVWVGHPHLRVIDNSTTFEAKVSHLLNEVLSVVGLPTPIEIERKFLIIKPDIEFLESIGAVKQEIFQLYLSSNDEKLERRIRQRGMDGNFSYYYTEKTDTDGMGRIQIERKISQSEYLGLMLDAKKMVRKDRYCLLHNNQYIEIDIYPNWENKAILEIELTNENQNVDLPPWAKVIKDVSNDINYRNISLAQVLSTDREKN